MERPRVGLDTSSISGCWGKPAPSFAKCSLRLAVAIPVRDISLTQTLKDPSHSHIGNIIPAEINQSVTSDRGRTIVSVPYKIEYAEVGHIPISRVSQSCG